jgi:hypothetical protein
VCLAIALAQLNLRCFFGWPQALLTGVTVPNDRRQIVLPLPPHDRVVLDYRPLFEVGPLPPQERFWLQKGRVTGWLVVLMFCCQSGKLGASSQCLAGRVLANT